MRSCESLQRRIIRVARFFNQLDKAPIIGCGVPSEIAEVKVMKELSQATKHVGSLLSFLRNPASLEGPLVMETKKSISEISSLLASRAVSRSTVSSISSRICSRPDLYAGVGGRAPGIA